MLEQIHSILFMVKLHPATKFTVDGQGSITSASTVESTSATTGSLIVGGGAGIAAIVRRRYVGREGYHIVDSTVTGS